jgi:hypothetical protein
MGARSFAVMWENDADPLRLLSTRTYRAAGPGASLRVNASGRAVPVRLVRDAQVRIRSQFHAHSSSPRCV